MCCNEGKTRYAIFNYFNKAGFNPEKDMLQVPVMTPESYNDKKKDWFQGEPHSVKFWKADTLRGVATDWTQMSSVDGLFVAGSDSGQGGATACSSGMYAANRAAEYAMKTKLGQIDAGHLTAEKERVYAPVKRANDPKAAVSWKELWAGLTRVMQQDCGDYRTIPICEHGLMWLDSIKKHEMQMTYARNPHELWRVLESESRITIGEIYLYSCLGKLKAEKSGDNKGKAIFNQLKDGALVTTFKEENWWLKPPYAPTYLENYEKCIAAEKGVK
jgi:succinate dehydrogenase/fumarate reductase flavoprotein subunit